MQHEERESIKHKIQHTVAQWYGGEGVEVNMQHEERKSIKHQGKSIKHQKKGIKHKIQHTVAQWYTVGREWRGVVIRRKTKINGQKIKKGGGNLGFVS